MGVFRGLFSIPGTTTYNRSLLFEIIHVLFVKDIIMLMDPCEGELCSSGGSGNLTINNNIKNGLSLKLA